MSGGITAGKVTTLMPMLAETTTSIPSRRMGGLMTARRRDVTVAMMVSRVAGSWGVLAEQDEFVTGQAGEGVAGAQGRAQALSDFDQDVVAGLVAEGVVDGLEAVQVDERQRDATAAAGSGGQGVFDAVVEQSPVGEAGELVVQGAVGHLLVGGAGLVTVVGHDEVGDGDVGQQLGPGEVVGGPGVGWWR